VKARKYQHCKAEYLRLAKEPNTIAEVRDRYLRIAQYYREMADTEPIQHEGSGLPKTTTIEFRFKAKLKRYSAKHASLTIVEEKGSLDASAGQA